VVALITSLITFVFKLIFRISELLAGILFAFFNFLAKALVTLIRTFDFIGITNIFFADKRSKKQKRAIDDYDDSIEDESFS